MEDQASEPCFGFPGLGFRVSGFQGLRVSECMGLGFTVSGLRV